MAKIGSFSSDIKKFQKGLERVRRQDRKAFMEDCAKELAARLLRKVIKRTPVGDYPKSSGKLGGTLRRGWTGGKSVSAAAYANSLAIDQAGDMVRIEIINPVEYAAYVEYGHRTASHKGWIPGKFMLTISEKELRSIAPAVLEKRLAKYLEDTFG